MLRHVLYTLSSKCLGIWCLRSSRKGFVYHTEEVRPKARRANYHSKICCRHDQRSTVQQLAERGYDLLQRTIGVTCQGSTNWLFLQYFAYCLHFLSNCLLLIVYIFYSRLLLIVFNFLLCFLYITLKAFFHHFQIGPSLILSS